MKKHQRLLDKGKIEKLVLTLRSIDSTNPEVVEKLRIETNYFERNAERMRYPRFRRQHLICRLGRHRSGMQSCNRLAPQAVRHVLVGARRQRHPRSAVLPAQRPI